MQAKFRADATGRNQGQFAIGFLEADAHEEQRNRVVLPAVLEPWAFGTAVIRARQNPEGLRVPIPSGAARNPDAGLPRPERRLAYAENGGQFLR